MHSIGLADFRAMWRNSRQAYLDAIERVGESGWLILGEEVRRFEEDLAAWWKLPWAVGTGNGLDALEIAFRCEGMQLGDAVLTTPLSAFATTLAILRVGAVPVFVDVDESGVMDLEQAALAMNGETRPRFIVPVHLFGHAMNLDALEAFAHQHQLVIIEDCAQAIGAQSGDRPVGSVSRICATSFYPTKNLGAFGDAGAVLTREASLRDHARRLRDYGQSAKYMHDEAGLNSRLDELQAALLRSVQLPALAADTARREAIARRYLAELRNPVCRLPVIPTGSRSVWHLFPTLVAKRAAFQEHLKRAQIHTAVHYPVLISDQPAMHTARHVVVGELPRARRFANEELSLPLHPFLSDDDVTRVINAVNSFRE